MKFISFLLLAVLVTGCVPKPAVFTDVPPYDPCNETELLALRQVPREQMTERQFAMYLELEDACSRHKTALSAAEIQAEPAREQVRILEQQRELLYYYLYALGGVVLVTAIVAVSSGN